MRQTGIKTEPVYSRPIAITHRYFHTFPSLNYVERWEYLKDEKFRRDIFFERYRGRLGAIWKSEQDKLETAWSLPHYLLNQPGIDPSPWNNVIHLKNSKDDVTIDEVYFSPRLHFHKAKMRATIKVDDVTTLSSGTDFWLGFEVTSAGGYAIASLEWVKDNMYIIFNMIGKTKIKTLTKSITQRYAGEYLDLFMEYSPPVFRVIQRGRTSPYTEHVDYAVMENVPYYDYLQPFIANESSVIASGFYLSHWAIWEIFDDAPTAQSEDYTDPTANPTLETDVGTRRNVEVYAKSIGASKTVKVYGSIDGTKWRLCDTLTTSSSSPYEIHKGYQNAYQFIKLELAETGTGTSTLEVTAI